MKKIIVDTNIVLRFIEKENYLFKELLDEYEVLIPIQVLIEIVFVLEKQYKKTREEIFGAMILILSEETISTDRDLIQKALSVYTNNKKLSIVDCYLLALAEKEKVEIKTLDKEMIKYLNDN